MELSNYSWKSKGESFLSKYSNLKNTSSTSKLSEFRSKLTSCRKSPTTISIPSWKVFRSQIRNNVSPPRVEKPKFEHYSDIASFRSNSPKLNGSPLWRNRIRNGSSIHSNLSEHSSPKPVRSNKIFQIIKIEELRKGIEAINEMDNEEFKNLPSRYLQELQEFCKIVKERIKA